MPYKRVDLLMDAFADLEDYRRCYGRAWLLKGAAEESGFSPKICNYLGRKVWATDVNEVYKMGDVFSTPGHIGLAMKRSTILGTSGCIARGNTCP